MLYAAQSRAADMNGDNEMTSKTLNLAALQDAIEAQKAAQQFAPAMQAIAVAIVAAKTAREALTDDQKAANEALGNTLATTIRSFAAETAAAGVPASVANAMLRQNLALMGLPAGTALNYGRAVEGFRKLADEGQDTSKASVKDAQRVMESDDTKAKNALREELKPYLRDATTAQLQSIVDWAKEQGIKLKERKVRSDKADSGATDEAKADETVPEGEAVAA